MCKRPKHQRQRKDFKPGRVEGWRAFAAKPDEIAERVSYAGSGRHKTYPAPNREWIPVHRPGTSECDQYADGEWKKIEGALRDAIRQSCVQWGSEPQFPARAWAFVNEVLQEARLSNPEKGEYHALD